MQRKEGFLIDVDYITVHEGGRKQAVVRLWCKDESGEDFVILDPSFEPYFYIFPRCYFEGEKKDVPHEEILRKKEIVERLCVRKGGEEIKAKRVEICHRNVFGVKRAGLRVVAEYPKDVPVLREAIQDADASVVALEADILFAIRYLIDKDLRLFDRIVVEYEHTLDSISQIHAIHNPSTFSTDSSSASSASSASSSTSSIPHSILTHALRLSTSSALASRTFIASRVFRASSSSSHALPPLRILAYDCEMAAPHGRMPNSRHDPIIIISCAFKTSESGVEGGEMRKKMFVAGEKEDDRRIISEFVDFVREFRPDIIVGYNIDAFDWIYLSERARIHGIKLNIGKDGSELRVEKSGGGFGYDVDIAGVLNVDLYKIAKRDLVDVKVKTLENVAEFLGAMRKEEREHLTPLEIYEIWNSDESSDERRRLLEYAIADAVSALRIAENLLPLQIELSRMLRHPLDLVASMGRGRQVEALLIAEAFKRGEIVPPKGSRDETYEGGFVLPPERGLHENVVSLDFSSMYPSIMVAFNISPDTFVPPEDVKDTRDVFIAPEVNHAFRKQPDGFFKRILRELMERRREIKRRMSALSESAASRGSAEKAKAEKAKAEKAKAEKAKSDEEARIEEKMIEYRMLDVQQQCIKILTNAFYGYTGWSAARFYKRECAEATTAWGRAIIKKAIEKAKKIGFDVIYGDTDSIFAKLPQDSCRGMKYEDIKAKTIEKAKMLSSEISKEFPLELEIKDFFNVIFFTGKKKRYAALTEKGEIIVRGLEVRRGDWCELAKDVQSKVIEIILKRRNVEEAANYVREVIKKLISGDIPIEKLTIYKTLTKHISGYESEQAHVVAAKWAKEHDFVYEIGSKIPYVIVEERVESEESGRSGKRGKEGKGGRGGKSKGKGGDKTSERAFPIEMASEIRGNEIIFADGRVFHLDTDYYVRRQIIPAAMRILQIFGYDESYFENSAQEKLSRWF